MQFRPPAGAHRCHFVEPRKSKPSQQRLRARTSITWGARPGSAPIREPRKSKPSPNSSLDFNLMDSTTYGFHFDFFDFLIFAAQGRRSVAAGWKPALPGWKPAAR
jgi:hypothetical protein